MEDINKYRQDVCILPMRVACSRKITVLQENHKYINTTTERKQLAPIFIPALELIRKGGMFRQAACTISLPNKSLPGLGEEDILEIRYENFIMPL